MKIGGLFKHTLEKVSEHSPMILTALGVAGIGLTVYCAIRDTNNVQDKIEELSEEYDGEIGIVDYTKAIAPHYIPTMVSAAATVTCIVGSNIMASHQRAMLASELLAANTIIREYSNKVRNIAPDIDRDIKQQIAKSHIDTAENVEGEITFIESYTGHRFKSTMSAVKYAEYELNRVLALRGSVALNEFFKFLDIPQVPNADDVGWCDTAQLYRGYKWVDFTHKFIKDPLNPKQKVCKILYPFEPHLGYTDDDIYYTCDDTIPFNEN